MTESNGQGSTMPMLESVFNQLGETVMSRIALALAPLLTVAAAGIATAQAPGESDSAREEARGMLNEARERVEELRGDDGRPTGAPSAVKMLEARELLEEMVAEASDGDAYIFYRTLRHVLDKRQEIFDSIEKSRREYEDAVRRRGRELIPPPAGFALYDSSTPLVSFAQFGGGLGTPCSLGDVHPNPSYECVNGVWAVDLCAPEKKRLGDASDRVDTACAFDTFDFLACMAAMDEYQAAALVLEQCLADPFG